MDRVPSTGNPVEDARLAREALDALERRVVYLSYADMQRLKRLAGQSMTLSMQHASESLSRLEEEVNRVGRRLSEAR